MNEQIMRVLMWVICISACALAALGILSFYIEPRYVEGVKVAQDAFKDILFVAVGVKGGSYIPRPDPPSAPKEE